MIGKAPENELYVEYAKLLDPVVMRKQVEDLIEIDSVYGRAEK
jgi:hypothetical protein